MASTALSTFAAASIASSALAAPPHIVLFIADDFSWHDSTPYGATDIRTPNLQRLADQSMRFDNAYCASPTCTPSRSALFTGLYPFRNGAHANHSLINDGLPTLPALMRDLGYRVVIAGKTHIGPRESFPFEYLENSNILPPGRTEVLYTDLNTAAVDQLLATHDRNQPLCLVIGSHSPHVYWQPNDGSYDPAKIKLPPYLADTPQTRRDRCDYYMDVTHLDEQVGAVLNALEQRGYADNTLFAFTADHGAQWPSAKWTCYDAGVRVPLLIRFPNRAKPGATAALVSLVDLLPTFLAAAGAEPPPNLDGQSLLPLLTGQTKQLHDAVFASHTGDKQMNQAPMRMIRTARWKLIVNLRPDIRYHTHIDLGSAKDGKSYFDTWRAAASTDIAAGRLLNRYYNKPPEELYDLQADPYELHNLAGLPEHEQLQNDLRDKLNAWRKSQGEDLNKVPMPNDARTGQLRYAG